MTKSVYVGYTEEEVNRMESQYFCLQFGGDFLLENDYYIFTKQEAIKPYNRTLKDLTEIVIDGTEKDRKYALDLIAGLAIKPMRFQ